MVLGVKHQHTKKKLCKSMSLGKRNLARSTKCFKIQQQQNLLRKSLIFRKLSYDRTWPSPNDIALSAVRLHWTAAVIKHCWSS